MLPLRYAAGWRIVGTLLMLLAFIAAVVPPDWLWPDEPGTGFLISDIWLHTLTFAVLALWFSGQYARRSYWRIVAGLVAFGLFIELVQRVLPYRSAEWRDLVADIAGVTTGILVAAGGVGGWSVRLEETLLNRDG